MSEQIDSLEVLLQHYGWLGLLKEDKSVENNAELEVVQCEGTEESGQRAS